MPGKPIQLLEPVPRNEQNEEGGFQFNKGFAEEFESQDKLAESKVVIISVAGAFRKGKSFLLNFLACDDKKPRENQELRGGIKQHFEQASCCLLPHPGRAVTRKEFKGQVNFLDDEFVNHLEQFVSHILSPEKLVVKRVNGKKLTGRELFSLVEVYFEEFRLGKLPTPKSIFTATVEMANLTASDDALRFFDQSMTKLADPASIDENELNSLLQTLLDQALEQFDSKCMERESPDTKRTREKLESQLRGLLMQQRMLNQLKSDRIAAERKNQMLNAKIDQLNGEVAELRDERSRNVTLFLQGRSNSEVEEILLEKIRREKQERQSSEREYEERLSRSQREKDDLKQDGDMKDKTIEEQRQAMEHLQQQIDEGKRRKKKCSIL